MPEIYYLRGDATAPEGEGPKVIVHVCNDLGAWGKGFVLALSARWPQPEAAYRRWAQERQPRFALGEVQFVEVAPQLWVANLIGQAGIRRQGSRPPVRYNAIREGLNTVATFALEQKASLHMPRIACGLAGGRWEEVEPLLRETLLAAGLRVTVYDL